MNIGDEAVVEKTFDLDAATGLAALAGASTPDSAVPEPLLAALFSYLLGVRLPGPGTNYLKQELRFLTPAPAERALTARVAVTRLRPEKFLADLETTIVDDTGALLVSGRALVAYRDTVHGALVTK